ncbi:MAG: D-glycero-beta-D-manno-heptose 1-phosphate adenylyltransferase [Bacteroidetes bacterium]|nr:D-glycero-beta-D-manno-heptose 1-phosphate adenylyltransferase [Bacteroidota bacterium]
MNSFDLIKSKIFYFNKEEDMSNFKRILAFWAFREYKTVFTNGCFDILHPGHVDYLSKAADLGKKLIVGLNTDSSVKNLKGDKRPVNNENDRALMLASLKFVDAVILFNENTPYDLIKIISPNILVKGSDYKPEEIAGYDIVKDLGGDIITIDLVEGYSTTLFIEKLKKL